MNNDRASIYPHIIAEQQLANDVNMFNHDEIIKSRFALFLKNDGKVDIQELLIKFCICYVSCGDCSNVEYNSNEMADKTFPIAFDELLIPGGHAFVNIKKEVLEYLTELNKYFKLSEKTHRIIINIVVAPKSINLPTPVRSDEESGKVMIIFDFIPKLFLEQQTQAYINSLQKETRVFAGKP